MLKIQTNVGRHEGNYTKEEIGSSVGCHMTVMTCVYKRILRQVLELVSTLSHFNGYLVNRQQRQQSNIFMCRVNELCDTRIVVCVLKPKNQV